MTTFPVAFVRAQFPALHRGDGFIFLDNAAGAQVPQRVLDAVHDHLLNRNVQRGAPYRRSQEVDAMVAAARRRVSHLLNAADPDEIAFGMNATSFMRMVSLAVGQGLGGQERHEVVVTDLDHEANVATWLALQAVGATIRWWRVREDGALHLADLDPLLSSRTRLVACAMASNPLGTNVDVTAVTEHAHSVGAEVFVDAVHYAPHGPIDVQALGCDYLVCSGYKIFSPHMGFLWGRREALTRLPTFREDFIPDAPPAKLEAGTFVYENVAGMAAAIDYLEDLGRRVDPMIPLVEQRAAVLAAMNAIRDYEAVLSGRMLATPAEIPGVATYGVSHPEHVTRRVPTFCFRVARTPSSRVAGRLAELGFGARSGHMYSPRLMSRLGMADAEGAVRVSLVHYNTEEEVERFGGALALIAAAA